MAEVRWSLRAEADLQAIEEFIAKDSVLRAIALADRVVEAAERLAVAPQVGRVVPEFNRTDLREIICRGYRVVYLLDGDQPTILRVVHGARDMKALVRREPWEF